MVGQPTFFGRYDKNINIVRLEDISVKDNTYHDLPVTSTSGAALKQHFELRLLILLLKAIETLNIEINKQKVSCSSPNLQCLQSL